MHFMSLKPFQGVQIEGGGEQILLPHPVYNQFCPLRQFGLFQQYVNFDNVRKFGNFSNQSILIILKGVRRNSISNFLRGHSLKWIFRLVYFCYKIYHRAIKRFFYSFSFFSFFSGSSKLKLALQIWFYLVKTDSASAILRQGEKFENLSLIRFWINLCCRAKIQIFIMGNCGH